MPTTIVVEAQEASREQATKLAPVRAQPLPRQVRIPLPMLERRPLLEGLTFLHAPSSLAHEALYSAAAETALHGTVLWRDAATMFDPRRVAKCAARMRVRAGPVLENIRIARSFTVHQFVSQMEALRDSVEEWEPALVIVTGFYTHFEDPDVDRWDARRLLRRTMLALGNLAALPRRGLVGRNEEDDNGGGFARRDETPRLSQPPLSRPGEARAGVGGPIVLCDSSLPRGLHKIVAPSLALEASYEALKRGVLAMVGDERVICRPRPPGQMSLEEFRIAVEGARAGEVLSREGSRGAERQQARSSSRGEGLSPASPVVPPPSITEWV